MNKNRSNVTKSLGSFYPYYREEQGEKWLYENLEELFKDSDSTYSIDRIAVLEVLNRYFMFGDRTILQGIKRSPWMGKYDSDKNSWSFHEIPEHGFQKGRTEREVANELFRLLCEEVKLYTESHKRVGILLSGGMDSRIVAGVLKHLMDEGQIDIDSVTAYTWGERDSRDVVYSKKIANRFGWEWKHFQVGAEDLWENLKIAGERGCEYTGLHLHAIPRISRNIKSEADVMLAGSYGDSVGRAEYSGQHVTELESVQLKIRNPFHLLKTSVYKQIKDKWKKDIETYHKLFPRDEAFQKNELDYQIHYMRRMLSPCMGLINEKVDMHQVFTHPKVFGLMWGLHPDLRNDGIYHLLLKKLNPELLTIPWARTGLKYPLKEGNPDTFKKKHHLYSEYIQEDLIERFESRLTTHPYIKNGIFNPRTIEKLIALIKKKKKFNFDYLEKISWLISYTYFVDKYDIDYNVNSALSLADKLNATLKAPLEYNLRHTYRKVRKELF